MQDLEATVLNEFGGNWVNTQHVHQAVSVGLIGERSLVVAKTNQVVQEVGGLRLVLVNASERDELGQSVSSHVTTETRRHIVVVDQVAIENADAVEVLVRVSALLDGAEESNTCAVVLNDSIDKSECKLLEKLVAADVVDNEQEDSDDFLTLLSALPCIKELSLLIVAHFLKLSNHFHGALRQSVVL